jgi:hypothetical protein
LKELAVQNDPCEFELKKLGERKDSCAWSGRLDTEFPYWLACEMLYPFTGV